MNIEKLITDIGITPGFTRLMWKDAICGQEVYLWGQQEGLDGSTTPAAYGPHRVIDVESRRLCNSRGRGFWEWPESLLVQRATTGAAQ